MNEERVKTRTIEYLLRRVEELEGTFGAIQALEEQKMILNDRIEILSIQLNKANRHNQGENDE